MLTNCDMNGLKELDRVADEIDFVAEYPKADMSKVNTIRVNGKEYVSIDHVSEIIDKQARDVEKSDFPKSDMGRGMIAMARCIKGLISALKADEGHGMESE